VWREREDHAELLAEPFPGWITGFPLSDQYGTYVCEHLVAHEIAVAEHLSNSKPKLPFLIDVGDVFHLRNVRDPLPLLGKVEVRFGWLRRAWFTARGLNRRCESVLGAGVALETTLDRGGINQEGIAFALTGCGPCRSVSRTKQAPIAPSFAGGWR
jgi:hypothetical protein